MGCRLATHSALEDAARPLGVCCLRDRVSLQCISNSFAEVQRLTVDWLPGKQFDGVAVRVDDADDQHAPVVLFDDDIKTFLH